MAPLPTNTTGRLFVDYSTQGHDHTLLCRFNDASGFGDAMTAVASFLLAHDTAISLVTVLGARVADINSDITYDVAWSGDETYGDGTGDEYKSAWFYDYVGRSASGRRVRAAVFGSVVNELGDNFRGTDAEAGWIGDVLTILADDPNVFCAIDGTPTIWKQYANLGTNAYWRNKIR
jgi:hypothetical protein